MFSTDWKLGKAAANDNTVGTTAWNEPNDVLNKNEALVSDASWFTAFLDQFGQDFIARDVRLCIDGDVIGTNEANNEVFGYTKVTQTIGSSSNDWGTTVTPDMLRNSSFGVAVSMARFNSPSTVAEQSQFLMITGMRFRIPKNAVVTGVEVRLRGNRDYAGPGIDYGYLYWVEMRVHYDYDVVFDGTGVSAGFVQFNEEPEHEISQQKQYQYHAFARNTFMGEWKDVTTIPKILNAINTLPGQLAINLARNLESREVEHDTIELSGYGGDLLVMTGTNEEILAQYESDYGVGEGTDLDVDHTVKVKEYYGGWEGLLTHEGEPLLTSQLEPLQVAVGYPRGRMYYHGYVSEFGLNYTPDDVTTDVKLLHISDELNNDVYRTADTLELNNPSANAGGWGFGTIMGKPYPGEITSVGQSFRAPSTFKLKRIVLPMSGWTGNIITVTVRTGSTIGSGTVLGVAQATLVGDVYVQQSVSLAFAEALSLTNATDYNFTLTSEFGRQTMSQSYPAYLMVGASLANANGRYYDGTWKDIGGDFGFSLWEEGGETRVNELSQDPSNIQKHILDYNVNNGGQVTYDDKSIEMSHTTVSAPFNTNTLKEGGDYVLKLAPADWYYYVDAGTLLYNLKSRPTKPDHIFTLRKDIISLVIAKNIESIVNEVLFTGGGDPALFKRYVDQASRQRWRKGLAKLSDNRVTDDTTAQILMESETDRNSQPIWIGTLRVLRSEYPRIPKPGEMNGFAGFGNLIDLLQVQMTSVETHPDEFVIQLGTQPPKTNKRIEDIKRNLQRLEVENNPDNPS